MSGLRAGSRQFDALLEAIAGLAAANMVTIETLHQHRVLDKRHFAHAFGRALDTLAPELRGTMTELTLRNMRDRCLNMPAGGESDVLAWVRQMLDESPGAAR